MEEKKKEEGWYGWATHGSPDSLDVDRAYFFHSLPSFRECQLFCSKKEDNRNIYVIKDGVVAATFKGLPDECNNSLLHTYPFHEQQYPLPITRKVQRIVPLKCVRAIRGVLTRFTKTKYRTIVKPALRDTNFVKRVKCLAGLDFATSDVGYEDVIEDSKSLAFQMGQTIALLQGVELYTKGEVGDYFTELKPFMQRADSVPSLLATLNKIRDTLVDLLKDVEIEEKGKLNLFKRWPSTGDDQFDWTGLIVDMKTERVVLVPPPLLAEEKERLGLDGDGQSGLVVGSFYKHDGKIGFATKESFEIRLDGKKGVIDEDEGIMAALTRLDEEDQYGLWVLERKGEEEKLRVKGQLQARRNKLTLDVTAK